MCIKIYAHRSLPCNQEDESPTYSRHVPRSPKLRGALSSHPLAGSSSLGKLRGVGGGSSVVLHRFAMKQDASISQPPPRSLVQWEFRGFLNSDCCFASFLHVARLILFSQPPQLNSISYRYKLCPPPHPLWPILCA